MGLSHRTLLSGGSVYFAQFCKGSETAEMGLCSIFENFVMEQYGTGKFIVSDPSEEERKQARQGFEHCKNVLSSGFFDLVVLDEIILRIANTPPLRFLSINTLYIFIQKNLGLLAILFGNFSYFKVNRGSTQFNEIDPKEIICKRKQSTLNS